MIGLLLFLFPGAERGLGDSAERFSSANSFHSDHESSWHPIKRIKYVRFKAFPFHPIHLPFDFEFFCQDLNNLQHTDWHGSLHLKDEWEGEGRLLLHIASRLALNKITASVRCCSTLLQIAVCANRESQLVHSIDASQAIIRSGTNQQLAVVVMHRCLPICLLSSQHTASWAGVRVQLCGFPHS